MSLLKNAILERTKRSSFDITSDETELTLAWVKGEVTLSQASRAFAKSRGIKHGLGIYTMFARALKKHINDKNIKL